MTLNDWLDKGWLVEHRPDRRELRELLGIADRAIADAEVKGISLMHGSASPTMPLCNWLSPLWRLLVTVPGVKLTTTVLSSP